MIELTENKYISPLIREENGVRFIELSKGDEFFASTSLPHSPGDLFENHPNTVVVRMHYKPKKWWQFWKKKEVIGCTVLYWPKENFKNESKSGI